MAYGNLPQQRSRQRQQTPSPQGPTRPPRAPQGPTRPQRPLHPRSDPSLDNPSPGGAVNPARRSTQRQQNLPPPLRGPHDPIG